MEMDNKTQILILDDEPIVCKRLKPALEKAGYVVETFTRSMEAMHRLTEKTFDLVITDLKMEGLDGMAFLTEVKKRTPGTEVIVITGFATMETARESYQKGVFDFIAKPFKLGEILDVVRKAEANRRQSQS
ncbi:MAG: response regulator [Deltaproteobacteria bacterium]|nr:response regulator [Deltaproteobacteria bacterium]